MAERGTDMSKLDCSICLSVFKEPKILPCYHTFCLQCLNEYVLRNGHDGKFECPLCRVNTEIPVGGVKSFQSNFYINVGNMSDLVIDCDVCGEGQESTHYCTDCEENFCERCTTSHTKMKVSREHTLIQLKDFSKKEGNYSRKLKKKYFCPQHKEEDIKMVCKDCDTKLCVVCKLTEHENHNTKSITKEAEERRTSLVNSIVSANALLVSLKAREYIVHNLATGIDKELEKNIASLEKRVESVIAKVKEDATNIKQELIKHNTKVTDCYLEKENYLRCKITGNEAVIQHAQNVLTLGDDNQVVNLDLVSKLNQLKLTEECVIKHHEYLIFDTDRSEIVDSLLGKISKISSTVTVTELDELTVQHFASSTQSNALSVCAGGLFAAFTYYNRFLHHDLKSMKSLYTDSLYESGTCAGLTCIGSDVYFTSVRDKSVYKLQTPKHVKVKFNSFEDYPHGIASRPVRNNDKEHELLICCSKSGKLLDTDASEGCVIAVSITGKKQYTWRNKEAPGPICIATNMSDGTVCLGYPAAHKVTLNASDGTVLSLFSGVGCHGNPELFCPVSVCFDSPWCIIIADYKNGAVIRIDKFGNDLQFLVKEKTPLSVLSVDNILYVGFEGKNTTRYELKHDKGM